MNSLHRNNYCLFIDESGTEKYKSLRRFKKHHNCRHYCPNPKDTNFFSLVGVLFESNSYIDKLVPTIKSIKKKLYGNENTVLHLSDMLSGASKTKVGKSPFSKYKGNKKIFIKDMERLLKEIGKVDFQIFIVHINKVEMLNRYSKPANPYKFAPTFIMERVSFYIANQQKNYLPSPIVRVWFESRSGKISDKGKKTTKDTLLKKYMVDELKLSLKKLKEETNFPRFSYAMDNIRRLEWHFHPIPKSINRIKKGSQYYKKLLSLYNKNVLHDLAHGIQLADIFVSAERKLKEYNAFSSKKFDGRTKIINNFLKTRIEIERIYPS